MLHVRNTLDNTIKLMIGAVFSPEIVLEIGKNSYSVYTIIFSMKLLREGRKLNKRFAGE